MKTRMKNSYFLDSSFSIALAVPSDEFHEKARELLERVSTERAAIVTTMAVLLEIGNSLSKVRLRHHAVEVIRRLRSESNVTVVSIADELVDSAFKLFAERMDKNWSLVDCMSFIVMQQFDIESALTADRHFIQAGFRALLRED